MSPCVLCGEVHDPSTAAFLEGKLAALRDDVAADLRADLAAATEALERFVTLWESIPDNEDDPAPSWSDFEQTFKDARTTLARLRGEA